MRGADYFVETCSAPVNIAVVKYWGKRDEELNLPVNSSISLSLDQEDLRTKTTVMASKHFETDRMWINGEEVNVNSKRIHNCLGLLRQLARDKKDNKGNVLVSKSDWREYKLHIVSVNNFPTAAGLASSASGFACFVYAISKLFSVEEAYPGQLSGIARLGSGSACRSMYGGWVKWEMGELDDGSDSVAVKIADENYWPELVVLILIFCETPKSIDSTSAMIRSTRSSVLLEYRAQSIVPSRMESMENSILNRDFQTFGELTMRDSNQFHAICLDTFPPVFYLNDFSKSIIDLVTQYNNHYQSIKAAYTFDAGPNAIIYTTKEVLSEFLNVIHYYFPSNHTNITPSQPPDRPIPHLNLKIHPNSLKKIIVTKPGSGPQTLHESQLLIDPETGLPLRSS